MSLDNLITNGDFENLIGGTGPGSTPFGWETTGHASGVFGRAGVETSRHDGYAFALGGWSGVGGQTISQEVETHMGEIYELHFDAGAAYGSFTGNLKVVADSPEGEIVLFELSAEDLGGSLSTYSARFAAQGDMTDIRFIFDGAGSGDIDLDNISMTSVSTMSVENGDLESAELSNGAWKQGIEGWEKTGSAGVWNPTSGHFEGEAAGGENVGWINSGSVSQVLEVPYNSSKTYDIDLTLGGRKGYDGSNYEIVLMAGDTVIGSVSGKTSGYGAWDTVNLSVPSGVADGLDGKPLKLVITKIDGLQLNFDDVTISVEKQVVEDTATFVAQNHNSDSISASHGINYGLWLNDIRDDAVRTVFDFEDPASKVFITVDGEEVTVKGVAVAYSLVGGSYVHEGTFELHFSYNNVVKIAGDNDLYVDPSFDGLYGGTVSRLDAHGNVVETFDYTNKSGTFGGVNHSFRLGDGFSDEGGPWKKPGISVDSWFKDADGHHVGDFHFTLGDQVGSISGRYFCDEDGDDLEDMHTALDVLDGGETYTIEAEDMHLGGVYQALHVGFASGGELIQTSDFGQGTATTTFGGATGVYRLDLTVLDETDGDSTINVLVNGELFQTLILDDPNTGATAGIDAPTLKTLSLDPLKLSAGDVITLEGFRDRGEPARIDKIDLTKLDAAHYTVEAEDMSLSGGYSVAGISSEFASEGAFIQTMTAGAGTATTTFDGDAGVYRMDLSVYDETDGASTIVVLVNGDAVKTFVLNDPNAGASAWVTGNSRKVVTIEGLKLQAGDEISIEGSKGHGEFARIDKFDLTQTGEFDPGVAGKTVLLLKDGLVIATTTTDVDGEYSFQHLELGDGYQVAFEDPDKGYNFVKPNVGDDDAIDSDVSIESQDVGRLEGDFGTTAAFTVDGDVADVDAGKVAAIVDEECTFQLLNHPKGGAAEPFYGLRADNLFGAGVYTFDFEADGVAMYATLDPDGGTLRIHGTAIGGVDTGTERVNEEKFEIDFTYYGLTQGFGDDDFIMDALREGKSYGEIRRLDADGNVVETRTIEDKAGAHPFSFRFGDEDSDSGHRGVDAKSGWGWLDFSGHDGHGDWLFTVGDKVDLEARDDCITVTESETAGDLEHVDYDLTELLRGKITATNSSNWDTSRFEAEDVIDGVIGDGTKAGRNFNHTRNGGDEWLELDLKDAYDLSEVVIFNRADAVGARLNGAELVVLDADRNEIARFDPITGATDGSQHSFDLTGLDAAQFIRVEHEHQYLHISEIKVMGKADTILANDTDGEGAFTGGVVTVDGESVKVGEWIELDKGRIKINEDGTVDFDADGDFEDLNDGEVEKVCVEYTIGSLPTGNLIVNGDFEHHGELNRLGGVVDGERDPWDTFDAIEGWTTPVGVLEIQDGTHSGTPDNPDGNSVLELDSHDSTDTNAAVEQVVNVEHAGTYTLAFDYSPRQLGSEIGATSEVNVFVNGTNIGSVSSDTLGYVRQTFNFELSEGPATIGFAGGGLDDSYGALIDNVSLTGVYEVSAKVTIKVEGESDLGSIAGRYFCDTNDDDLDNGEAEPAVVGATVWLKDGADNTIATTTTDADGRYEFTGLLVGDYQVFFQDPDAIAGAEGKVYVAPNAGDDTIDSDVTGESSFGNGRTDVFTLGNGENKRDVDAGIVDPGTGSLSGRYFCDDDGDGFDNEPDNAVAGVTVTLLDAAGKFVRDAAGNAVTTVTDADGNYSFGGLKAGTYGVTFDGVPVGKELTAQNADGDVSDDIDSDAALNPAGDPEIIDIVVTIGNDTPNNDVGVVYLPGSLSGRYFCDTDNDDQDNGNGGEPGIAGVLVELLDAAGNGTGITTRTDSSGNYSFIGLDPGTYGVKFTDPDNVLVGKRLITANVGDDASDSDAMGDATMSTITGITVVAGENTPDNDAGVEEPGSLSGRYFCDEDGDNLDNDGAGNGVSGVMVSLFEADGITPATDIDGNLVLSVLTGADGSYSFTNLEAGNYTVMFTDTVSGGALVTPNAGDDTIDSDAVDMGGGVSTISGITVVAGANTPDNDAGVKGTASVGDTVWFDENRDGQRQVTEALAAGVAVTLLADLDGGGALDDVVATATTDANGEYLFDGLKAGDYRIEFGLLDGFEFTTPGADADDAVNDDSDAGAGGLTDAFTLDIGEAERDIDAGLVRINEDPEPMDDMLKICADEEGTANVLDNDSDPEGDMLTITMVDGQAITEGATITTAAGTFVTLVGGQLVVDGEAAYAALDIGDEAIENISYTVTDTAGNMSTANLEVTFCGDANSADSLAAAIDGGTASFEVRSVPIANFAEAYTLDLFSTDVVGLSPGTFEAAYCLDSTQDIDLGVVTTANVYVANEANVALVAPTVNADKIDSVNWLLNNDFTTVDNGDGTGDTYTDLEVQEAIWILMNDDVFFLNNFPFPQFTDDENGVRDGAELATIENAQEIAMAAMTSGDGFEAGDGDIIGLILDPTDPAQQDQPFIIGVHFDEIDCLC